MTKPIDMLLEQIAKKDARVNLMIQVQSYGRVFIYDQSGVVVDKDNAIYISDSEYSNLEKIEKGLTTFLSRMGK